MPARSYLYVPGDSAAKLARAFEHGADAVIFDLEDAVPPGAKHLARERVAAAVARTTRQVEVFVRVNADDAAADIEAVVRPGIAGIVVPKATPASLRAVNSLLDGAEAATGMTAGLVRTIPLIESAAGVLGAAEIAATPRVLRLGIGEADLIADLGMRPGPDRDELLAIRTQIVVASAAAGIAGPIGPVQTDVSTVDGLAESTRRLLSLGFRARSAIHPRQLPAINDVFVPTPEEVAAARQTLTVLDEAMRQGLAVAVLPDGQMVDPAVARSARDVVDRWDAAYQVKN